MLKPLPTDPLTQRIIGCALEVHKVLGPGLLEHAYELQHANLGLAIEHPVTIDYKGVQVPFAYRIDMLVEDAVVVEVKVVGQLLPVHRSQVLTYLRLGNYPVGLLLNFSAALLKDGIVRVINGQSGSERKSGIEVKGRHRCGCNGCQRHQHGGTERRRYTEGVRPAAAFAAPGDEKARGNEPIAAGVVHFHAPSHLQVGPTQSGQRAGRAAP